VIGIDIGKNSFHVVGQDKRGATVLRQKWLRGQVEDRFANLPRCLIDMEACVGAHHLSRKLQVLGHDARLMPAKYVRPYSKGQKNDFRDAEAIAEAVQRPTMKFVATKCVDQLDLQALHRVHERLVSERTGIINQIRAFLLERGVAVRQGLRFLRAELPGILATPNVLSPRMLRIIEDLVGDWRRLDERIEGVSGEIEAVARQDKACERLMTVPGIEPLISSAMVAAIGSGDVFAKGRDFGAWLGLVPKQISTGDRTILGSISKRGNRYLRALFAAPCAWRACTRTAQHTSRRAAAEQAAKPLRKEVVQARAGLAAARRHAGRLTAEEPAENVRKPAASRSAGGRAASAGKRRRPAGAARSGRLTAAQALERLVGEHAQDRHREGRHPAAGGAAAAAAGCALAARAGLHAVENIEKSHVFLLGVAPSCSPALAKRG
jgi:transposase